MVSVTVTAISKDRCTKDEKSKPDR